MNNLPEATAAWEAYELKLDMAIAAASVEVSMRLKNGAMNMIRGKRKPGEKATSGEPPMNRTGTLRNSVSASTSRIGFGTYSAIVGADTDYARAVEIGSPYNPPSWQNGEHFPFIQPAVETFAQAGLTARIVRKHLGAIQ